MTDLGKWLRWELQRRGLTQNQAAVYAGVAPATISEILNRDHIPKVETLFRLADYFEMPREEVLRRAGHLPPGARGAASEAQAGVSPDDYLIEELLREFRRVPDEWKEEVISQVATFARLASRPPVRVIGDEEAGEAPAGVSPGEEARGADQEAADALRAADASSAA